MNNCGELVFSRRINNAEPLEEIFQYDNGKLNRLTTDGIRDAFPEIAQDGAITWTYDADGAGGGTVVLYDAGSITYVAPGFSPVINDFHDLAWVHYTGQGCLQADADIFFCDGSSIVQVTEDDRSNQIPRINNAGEITWPRFDFCPNPWESNILLRRAGTTWVVSRDSFEPNWPDINEQGAVVWGGDADGLELYSPLPGPFSNNRPRPWGVVTLTTWGRAPRINNHGDVTFLRWHDDSSTWQVWLYQDGFIRQLTFPPLRHTDHDINDWGEVVLQVGQFPSGDISLMRRIRTGEADFDGDIDLDDARVLHDCLTGPGDFDRLCDCRFLDLDHDRDVDLADFARFQRAFTGGQ